MPKKTFSISLNTETWERIDELARNKRKISGENVSRSQIVENLIEEFLKSLILQPAPEQSQNHQMAPQQYQQGAQVVAHQIPDQHFENEQQHPALNQI